MELRDLKGQRIAFLASGGLDSCTITHWLAAAGVRVVCMTANLGQPDEASFDDIGARMRACGAEDFIALDAIDAIAEIGLEVVQAQARYEGGYWNTTGAGRVVTTRAGRVVTTRAAIAEMQSRGLTILSHGATGRGNDQLRFQLIAAMLCPQIRLYVPWRDPAFLQRFGGRREMIAYCEQHGLPIKASSDAPYSTDANLLGLTHEGGRLESLDTGADLVTPGMGVWPESAHAAPETVAITFAGGTPIALDGQALRLTPLIARLNTLAGGHGIGIGIHVVENRFVGVKSRGVYESPGLELLGAAYRFLMQIVLDRRATELHDSLSAFLARQLYQGYWEDLGSQMARTSLHPATRLITGTLQLSLYRGTIRFLQATDAPHSLFTADGSMESEGALNHTDAEGFTNILSLSARTLGHAGQICRVTGRT